MEDEEKEDVHEEEGFCEEEKAEVEEKVDGLSAPGEAKSSSSKNGAEPRFVCGVEEKRQANEILRLVSPSYVTDAKGAADLSGPSMKSKEDVGSSASASALAAPACPPQGGVAAAVAAAPVPSRGEAAVERDVEASVELAQPPGAAARIGGSDVTDALRLQVRQDKRGDEDAAAEEVSKPAVGPPNFAKDEAEQERILTARSREPAWASVEDTRAVALEETNGHSDDANDAAPAFPEPIEKSHAQNKAASDAEGRQGAGAKVAAGRGAEGETPKQQHPQGTHHISRRHDDALLTDEHEPWEAAPEEAEEETRGLQATRGQEAETIQTRYSPTSTRHGEGLDRENEQQEENETEQKEQEIEDNAKEKDKQDETEEENEDEEEQAEEEMEENEKEKDDEEEKGEKEMEENEKEKGNEDEEEREIEKEEQEKQKVKEKEDEVEKGEEETEENEKEKDDEEKKVEKEMEENEKEIGNEDEEEKEKEEEEQGVKEKEDEEEKVEEVMEENEQEKGNEDKEKKEQEIKEKEEVKEDNLGAFPSQATGASSTSGGADETPCEDLLGKNSVALENVASTVAACASVPPLKLVGAIRVDLHERSEANGGATEDEARLGIWETNAKELLASQQGGQDLGEGQPVETEEIQPGEEDGGQAEGGHLFPPTGDSDGSIVNSSTVHDNLIRGASPPECSAADVDGASATSAAHVPNSESPASKVTTPVTLERMASISSLRTPAAAENPSEHRPNATAVGRPVVDEGGTLEDPPALPSPSHNSDELDAVDAADHLEVEPPDPAATAWGHDEVEIDDGDDTARALLASGSASLHAPQALRDDSGGEEEAHRADFVTERNETLDFDATLTGPRAAAPAMGSEGYEVTAEPPAAHSLQLENQNKVVSDDPADRECSWQTVDDTADRARATSVAGAKPDEQQETLTSNIADNLAAELEVPSASANDFGESSDEFKAEDGVAEFPEVSSTDRSAQVLESTVEDNIPSDDHSDRTAGENTQTAGSDVTDGIAALEDGPEYGGTIGVVFTPEILWTAGEASHADGSGAPAASLDNASMVTAPLDLSGDCGQSEKEEHSSDLHAGEQSRSSSRASELSLRPEQGDRDVALAAEATGEEEMRHSFTTHSYDEEDGAALVDTQELGAPEQLAEATTTIEREADPAPQSFVDETPSPVYSRLGSTEEETACVPEESQEPEHAQTQASEPSALTATAKDLCDRSGFSVDSSQKSNYRDSPHQSLSELIAESVAENSSSEKDKIEVVQDVIPNQVNFYQQTPTWTEEDARVIPSEHVASEELANDDTRRCQEEDDEEDDDQRGRDVLSRSSTQARLVSGVSVGQAPSGLEDAESCLGSNNDADLLVLSDDEGFVPAASLAVHGCEQPPKPVTGHLGDIPQEAGVAECSVSEAERQHPDTGYSGVDEDGGAEQESVKEHTRNLVAESPSSEKTNDLLFDGGPTSGTTANVGNELDVLGSLSQSVSLECVPATDFELRGETAAGTDTHQEPIEGSAGIENEMSFDSDNADKHIGVEAEESPGQDGSGVSSDLQFATPPSSVAFHEQDEVMRSTSRQSSRSLTHSDVEEEPDKSEHRSFVGDSILETAGVAEDLDDCDAPHDGAVFDSANSLRAACHSSPLVSPGGGEAPAACVPSADGPKRVAEIREPTTEEFVDAAATPGAACHLDEASPPSEPLRPASEIPRATEGIPVDEPDRRPQAARTTAHTPNLAAPAIRPLQLDVAHLPQAPISGTSTSVDAQPEPRTDDSTENPFGGSPGDTQASDPTQLQPASACQAAKGLANSTYHDAHEEDGGTAEEVIATASNEKLPDDRFDDESEPEMEHVGTWATAEVFVTIPPPRLARDSVTPSHLGDDEASGSTSEPDGGYLSSCPTPVVNSAAAITPVFGDVLEDEAYQDADAKMDGGSVVAPQDADSSDSQSDGEPCDFRAASLTERDDGEGNFVEAPEFDVTSRGVLGSDAAVIESATESHSHDNLVPPPSPPSHPEASWSECHDEESSQLVTEKGEAPATPEADNSNSLFEETIDNFEPEESSDGSRTVSPVISATVTVASDSSFLLPAVAVTATAHEMSSSYSDDLPACPHGDEEDHVENIGNALGQTPAETGDVLHDAVSQAYAVFDAPSECSSDFEGGDLMDDTVQRPEAFEAEGDAVSQASWEGHDDERSDTSGSPSGMGEPLALGLEPASISAMTESASEFVETAQADVDDGRDADYPLNSDIAFDEGESDGLVNPLDFSEELWGEGDDNGEPISRPVLKKLVDPLVWSTGVAQVANDCAPSPSAILADQGESDKENVQVEFEDAQDSSPSGRVPE
eukprot:GHVT01095635.1.p1 GENE.GHVT01095635.1~~GHVT01095635.1.p1  ORF type:complete len:2418 (-),score=641.96 GHVT01095635.1:766-7728(-)